MGAWLPLLILALTALDQGIKLAILQWGMGAHVALVPGLVWFSPMQNLKLSWFGSLGVPLFDQLWFNVVFSLVLLYLAVGTFAYLIKKLGVRSRYAGIAFAVLMAGAVCSVVDTVLWGGSIDYIALRGLFTFDLKDAYLSGFVVLALIGIFRFRKRVDEVSIREIVRYCLTWK